MKMRIALALLASLISQIALAQTPSLYVLKDSAGTTFNVGVYTCPTNKICPISVSSDSSGNALSGPVGTTNANGTALYVQGVTGGVPLTATITGTLPAFASAPTVNLGTIGGAATQTTLAAIQTALGSPFQAGGSVGITGTLPAFAATPTFNIGTAPTITVTGTVAATQSGAWTVNPTTAANWGIAATAAAVPANAVFVGMAQGGNLTGLTGTSGNLNVQCANCSGSGVSTADEAAFTGGTSLFAGGGGFFQTTATNNALTTGQQGMFQVTANRALFSNLRNAAGTEVGTAGAPLQVSLANTGANGTAVAVSLTSTTITGTVAVTQSGSWSLAANQTVNVAQINGVTPLMGNGVTGTGSQRVTIASDNTAFAVNATLQASATTAIGKVDPNTIATWGLAAATQNVAAPTNGMVVMGQFTTTPTTLTTTNVSPLQMDNAGNLLVNIKAGSSSGAVAQGSTTSGQTGGLSQCAVTTAAPTYTTATTNPFSCDTAGNQRVLVTNATPGIANNADSIAAVPASATSPVPVNNYGYVWNNGGTVWDRMRSGTTTGSVLINGAGTAGAATGGIVTVQGVASMTPILTTTTLNAETTKVIGTVNQGTSPWVVSLASTTITGNVAAIGPTAVGSANANPPIVIGGTATGAAGQNVQGLSIVAPSVAPVTATNTAVVTSLRPDSPGIIALGQTTKSASVPVAIASDQIGPSTAANSQPVTVGPAVLGSYCMGANTGTMAAGLAAGAPVYSFRYGAANLAIVRKVIIEADNITTAFVAGAAKFDMIAARTFTASDTGGTAGTLTGNNGKLRTSFATTGLSDLRISSTATLTAGTRTLDAQPLASIEFSVPTSIDADLLPTTTLFQSQVGESPFILAQNEGFVLQATVPGTGTWVFSARVCWDEVSAF